MLLLLQTESLEIIVKSPLLRDLQDQLERFQKAIRSVERSKSKINATMKEHYSEEPESAFEQLRLFTHEKKWKGEVFIKFGHTKLDEFMSLLVVNNVSDRAWSNQSHFSFL